MDDGLYVVTEKRVLRVFCSLYETMREDVGQQNTAPGCRFGNQEVRTESGGWLLSLHSPSGTNETSNETSKLVPSSRGQHQDAPLSPSSGTCCMPPLGLIEIIMEPCC